MEVEILSADDAFVENDCYVLDKSRAERSGLAIPKIKVQSIICSDRGLPRDLELMYSACFLNAASYLKKSIKKGKYSEAWFFVSDASWRLPSVTIRHNKIWKKLGKKWDLEGFSPHFEFEKSSENGIRYIGMANLSEAGIVTALQIMREYPSTILFGGNFKVDPIAWADQLFNSAFPLKKGIPDESVDWLSLILKVCSFGGGMVKIGGSYAERAVSVEIFSGHYPSPLNAG